MEFDFDGLNLQMFSGDTLINDYFNIDRRLTVCLRDCKKYIEKNQAIIIRSAPKTKIGVSNVYSEIPIPLYSDKLELRSDKEIKLL